jgi:hypothetical protein
MGIAKNGPFGMHVGKVGNLVYYELNGKNVVREIGKSSKPPTEKQLKVQMETTFMSSFFSKIVPFIRPGFAAESERTKLNAHNICMKQDRREVIAGIYPDLELAYDHLEVSRGTLRPAVTPMLGQSPEGLQFSWHTDPKMDWPESSDQVMLLAYFPEIKELVYKIFGNSWFAGADTLEIPVELQEQRMEVYISFIAADRTAQANSTYMGRLN